MMSVKADNKGLSNSAKWFERTKSHKILENQIICKYFEKRWLEKSLALS